MFPAKVCICKGVYMLEGESVKVCKRYNGGNTVCCV